MRTRTARTTRSRSVTLAVAAVSLLIGFAVGCGGDTGSNTGGGAAGTSDTADASSKRPATRGAPAPAAPSSAPTSQAPTVPAAPGVGAGSGKVLSQADLDRAILADGDVPGFSVGPMDPPPAKGERATKAACVPLTAVINGIPEPVGKAASYRQITGAGDGTPAVAEFLTTHGTRDAKALVSRLRTAVADCAGGFRATGGDTPSTYTAVKGLAAPKTGDETLKYQVTGDFEGDPVPLVFHVVRVGGTVATFYTVNLEGAATPELPQALVAAQTAKLK